MKSATSTDKNRVEPWQKRINQQTSESSVASCAT